MQPCNCTQGYDLGKGIIGKIKKLRPAVVGGKTGFRSAEDIKQHKSHI